MADTYGGVAVRSVGFVYGVVSTVGGVAVFVLFVGVPADLLSLLPPWMGRTVLTVAPWVVTTGTGRAPGTEWLLLLLGSVGFVVFGLWSLGKALFGSTASLPSSP